jgi:CTP:phosphocholine cytidylyltransferase-like protein/thiamine kinase-like enzyme
MSRIKNAVILAAGKSSKFFPPLYDRPKGLFEYRGERLIERQIRQLREAGVGEVTVVVGYEKELFFHLRDELGVRLVVSTGWADEGSMASLALAADALRGGAFLCAADHWFEGNPFLGFEPHGRSVRMVQKLDDATREFVVDEAAGGRLSGMRNGAPSGLCMVGAAYLTAEFAEKMFSLWDTEHSWVGSKSLFWEQFWGRHANELPLYGVPSPEGYREFDSLGDFGADGVLHNMDQAAVGNICRLLECDAADISEVRPLNAGLTNVSFSFVMRGERYVYRHPGASSSALVDRDAEVVAQRKASELGIDYSVIDISPQGWKLSRFVPSERRFDYDDPEDLAAGVEQIRRFHESGAACAHETDLLRDGDGLLARASTSKGDLASRLKDVRDRVVRVWHHVELDGWPKVLCHNDTYAVNWIVGPEGPCLIDWEYAGMDDSMADLATMPVRDSLSREKYDEIVALYFGGEPTFEQKRHAYGVAALSGWYWMCWALFKDTLGEDGYFMLSAWTALNEYSELALDMYEGGDAR